MIWAKVHGRKHSKGSQNLACRYTFSDVFLVKTELGSNDIRIQLFCFGKSHISFKCVSWKSTRWILFPSKNNEKKSIKANEDQHFLWWLWKEPFETALKETFKNVLELFVRGRVNRFFYKFLILLSCRSRS